MSGGFRASTIPSNVRKTIQNIKEITGNHSDDDVYAMLKECSMDPNETAQKLLHQDTFHEVKRKKDRKKENQINLETIDSRWKLGPSGRGGRGGRGNYTSRYAAQRELKVLSDANIGRSTASHKENGVSQAVDKASSILSPAESLEGKSKNAGSSVAVMANGPIGVVSDGAKSEHTTEVSSESVVKQPEMSSLRQSHIGAGKRSNMAFAGWESGDALGKVGAKSHGAGKSQAAEVLQPSLSTPGGSSSSRPSSNYGSRLQHGTGSLKVGPNKEWKPKPTHTNSVEGLKPLAASNGSNVSAEAGLHTQSVQSTTDSEEATKLQKELESLHVRDTQHVIIPNHIHVPEAVRTSLSFGSFDSPFVITSGSPGEPENQKNSEASSETQEGSEATIEQQDVSQNTMAPPEDADYVDNSQSTAPVPKNVSSDDVGVASSLMPDHSDSKKEIDGGLQHSSVDSSSNYNFGLMPAVLSSPLGALEGSDSQPCDVSRVPSLVVQPPVDPSSFYARIYRSGSDNDGRISPFPAPGVATKYNGNVAFLSAQTSQSPAEGGNSLVLSMEAQTPLATQAAGMMPTSMAVTQQPMPLFRQPPGVHLPHYPPNFIPYGHYFSPFFVPPPAMHQFLANNAFPQQHQGSSVYPGPPVAATAATAVTFPLSQYKPGSNTRNSAHMGVGGIYGPYGAPSAGHNPGPTTTAGNSTANEDLVASQFKENNVYRQQTEGSAVWIPAPGREISSLSGNSFYNLTPQGQHVSFAPTQAGQATFPGIYHPAQAVTAAAVHPLLQQSQAMPGVVDMVGATASVYQPPQHAQMNWPSNF